MLKKAASGVFSRVIDSDVYPTYYPYKLVGEFDLVDETKEQQVIRISRYLTYLGIKYKLLSFLKEAMDFENLLIANLTDDHINLFENTDMLGFNYIYGYQDRESITKLTIEIDGYGDIDALIKLSVIVNSIYHEHIIRDIDESIFPNRLFMLKIANFQGDIEKLEIEAFKLSNKIGLKTGRLVTNSELNQRIHGYKTTPAHVAYLNKTYHSDFLIQIV